MTKTFSVAEAQTKFPELVADVAAHKVEVLVTCDGEQVAKIVPIRPARTLESLRGSVRILGDIVEPLDVVWEADE